MTIIDLDIFEELLPYFRLTNLDHNRRIDFKPMPASLFLKALQTKTNCVSCGAEISPIIRRKVRTRDLRTEEQGAFLSSSCPKRISGCSNGKAARDFKGKLVSKILSFQRTQKLKTKQDKTQLELWAR